MTSKSPFGGVEAFYQQSLDTLERMSISDESEGYPDLTHLGVKLSTLQQRMPWEVGILYIRMFKKLSKLKRVTLKRC